MTGAPKKRVVFVLPLLCSGGAERALITLMNNLDQQKFTPEMVVLNEAGPMRDWIKPDIPLHSLGGVRISRAFFKLKKKLKELKPDIVISTMAHMNFVLLLLHPFFSDVKFVVREAVVPSALFTEHKNKVMVLKLLYKILYRKADLVLCPSKEIIKEFSALGINTEHYHALYNQVDEQAIQSKLNPVAFPKEGDNVLKFVCVGRLHYQKGFDRLIEALKDFNPPYDWVLYILGDGKEKDNLQDLIKKLSLEKRVFLYGNVTNPWPIIAGADRLLFPSRWEGMPNAVLESLACGTKVLASSEANGVAEIQIQCKEGLVETVENMTDMVQAMESLVPENKDKADSSLLPSAFKKDTIMAMFENLLS